MTESLEAGGADLRIVCHGPEDVKRRLQSELLCSDQGPVGSPAHDPRWLLVLHAGLGHSPYLLEAYRGAELVGWLPLSFVRSWLFGRFLVSLPYINSAGIRTVDAVTAEALVERAVELARQLNVRYLELRHEQEVVSAALPQANRSKVHMRLRLADSADLLWKSFDPKVRNQIRKGEKQNFSVRWGGAELVDRFYEVFSRNMRDLGTPVFGRSLFGAIAHYFGDEAEFCVVSAGDKPIAAGLLVHGKQMTEVPSASALREYNSSCANMFLYWQLLQRAVARGQTVFDFGRSSVESSTYRFKQQWGAEPTPAIWQYHVRSGTIGDMRLESGKYGLAVRVWKKLPLWLTNCLGPVIVRGIP
ncbi:MAG: FemAB family XrtA/PEP-CTERM system-associated protein [Planctomycetota bacterium]